MLIYVCDKTILLNLRTQSETNDPFMHYFSKWSLFLSHRDSRVSKSASSPLVISLAMEPCCILGGEIRGETYAGTAEDLLH